ncbi:hypothetical protein ACFXPX_36690 [Kitasatospora sp. NPDC059146]|uniref:hypothetical protein n=1 Tax=unclassified Kitasatospora TaxID=2633591 RepID=UPI003696933A
MTDFTQDQATTYIDSVETHLAAAGLRPRHLEIREYDEYDTAGNTIPSAVLTWRADHPLVSAEQHPDGLLAAWSTENGWQWASLREDGSTEQPAGLPLDALADPAQVGAALLPISLGLRADAGEQAVIDAIREASRGVKHGTPTYETCTCHTHPCGGVGWDRIEPTCPDHGAGAPCLMWHWAACCPANP